MSFIRTKYDVIEESFNNPKYIVWLRMEEQPIARAETIDKLCDNYVCNNLLFYTKSQLEHYCYIPSKTIYGAIWTDKGLIYVAKMNEEGELCLL